MGNKGKRYNQEGKLNYKKVFAVILAVVVVIMFFVIVKKLISRANQNTENANLNYYALYADDKWGVISSNGKVVIEPMYPEMITVINNSRDVFLCTYDIDKETGSYETKVVNKNNEEIFTGYDKIEALENYDSSENIWFEKDVFKVQKNGKYGLINIDGKEILSIQYDSIETLKGVPNSLIVKKDGMYGIVNTSGATVVSSKYAKIEKMVSGDKKAYITIDSENKYGLVNTAGIEVLENKYEKIENIYGEKYFVIQEDKKQVVIDDQGEKVLTEGFDSITQINSKGVVFVKDKKYGFMDYEKNTVVPAEYENLKQINDDVLVAKKDGKCGLIDLENNKKVELNYKDIYYEEKAGFYVAESDNYNSDIIDTEFTVKLTGIISELNTEKGYIQIKSGDEYKYYNLKLEEKEVKDILTSNTLYLSKKDGKYGFVDKDGKVVVDYIYEDAVEQNTYGYAAVKKDGLWGSIDKLGNVVIEPQYDLEKNLIIDFIGKWHLGKDLNMNYYCEKIK